MEPTELKAEAQEMFNVVVEHLRKQNAKSEREADHKYCVSSICCYRSPDGKKCAIGCLIPDEEHDPKMDENAGSDIDQLIKSWLSVPLREKFKRHSCPTVRTSVRARHLSSGGVGSTIGNGC